MGLGVDGWTKDTRTILSTVQQLKRLGVRAEPKWLKIMRKYPPLNMSPLYEKPEHSHRKELVFEGDMEFGTGGVQARVPDEQNALDPAKPHETRLSPSYKTLFPHAQKTTASYSVGVKTLNQTMTMGKLLMDKGMPTTNALMLAQTNAIRAKRTEIKREKAWGLASLINTQRESFEMVAETKQSIANVEGLIKTLEAIESGSPVKRTPEELNEIQLEARKDALRTIREARQLAPSLIADNGELLTPKTPAGAKPAPIDPYAELKGKLTNAEMRTLRGLQQLEGRSKRLLQKTPPVY